MAKVPEKLAEPALPIFQQLRDFLWLSPSKSSWLLSVVILAFVGAQDNKAWGENPQKSLKVGVILGLTGLGSSYNADLREGMEFCKKSAKTEMIFEDSQNSAVLALSAFNKLVDNNHIDLAVVSFSPISRAVIPVARTRHVPLLMTLVSASSLTKDAGPLAFRFFSSGRQEGPILAELGKVKLGFKRTAVLALEDDYGHEYAQYFGQRFRQLGGQIPTTVYFAKSELDLRSVLLRIKVSSPDSVLAVGLNEHLEIISRQMRDMGFVVPFMTNWSGLTPTTANKLVEALGSFYTTAPNYYLPGRGRAVSFIEEIEKKLQRKISAYGALGCDVQTLIDAAAASGDVVRFFSTLKDFSGVMGELQTNKEREIEFSLHPVVVSKKGISKL